MPTMDIVDWSLFPSLPLPGSSQTLTLDLRTLRGTVPPNTTSNVNSTHISKQQNKPLPALPTKQDAGRRPGIIRRASSFEDKRPGGNRAGVGAGTRSHARTASDSTLGRIPHSLPSTISRTPRRTTSITVQPAVSLHGSIPLSHARLQAIKLLKRIQALTPASRTGDVPQLPPSSAHLHPAAFITPLAIVLETLVNERTILRMADGEIKKHNLPVLRDGTTLQLAGEEGELDWRSVRLYVRAIGSVVDQILPLLRAVSSEEHRTKVEELEKQVKVYVGKIKKVFGEVAALYVDKYGFMRGWWDETDMKGAAGEVGRWGDLLDA
ncbi:hypothetical protein BCR39DRAFT_465557 [Naematelia encephala]|uniref:Uncharacterized protein n=1 Tax=Naematelia encephala TaxID=71784 RepID=A0A1Y2BA10_9TREE|nr:hypothetical protein BCR39DRAFT_465557 [Naematelia encephala]